MRVIKTILILLVALLASNTALAQVAAVMQAKVNIISGASFSSSQQNVIDLSSASSQANFEALNFSLVAAPQSDIDISISEDTELINETGKVIGIEGYELKRTSLGNGKHSVSVQGKLKDGQQLDGNYRGSFTAVVEYL